MINNNLQQQAQALFKAWFEDFVPFGGVMPSDWRRATLRDVCAISTATFSPIKNPDVVVEHYSIPAYDDTKYPVFEIASGIKSNKYALTPSSVIISKLNPDTKRIWRPYCISSTPICSTEFIVYEAHNSRDKDFVYSLIDSVAFTNYLCSHTTGSTNSRQRATPSTTLDFPICLPADSSIIEEFCGLVTPLYDRVSMNILESQKLTALRDSLLPKLMRGEMDVSAVEV